MANPFQLIGVYWAFTLISQQACNQGDIPTGYGVAEEEWIGSLYPDHEVITIGHGKREYKVALLFVIWWLHAVLWTKGLDVMTHICMIEHGKFMV